MFWKTSLGERTLKGNFAPIQRQRNLELCTYFGTIPVELHGGQYVRNGGNPTFGDNFTGHVHMFDGDGMLAGVLFRTTEQPGKIEPCFVNKYILTDVYLATKSMPWTRSPILPSMATLINPLTSTVSTFYQLCRFLILIIWSHLNGHGPSVRKISVANTAIVYHDKKTLATCQTGPPMRVQLPNLETVEWFNGSSTDYPNTTPGSSENLLGRSGLLGFLKDWTTSHVSDNTTGN
jgi:carotenoid cleavage dioxygenase-like enzyme